MMCVDNTSVIMSGNDLKSLIQSVNVELCLLNTWLKAKKLSLNVNKTYYLIFHRARIKVDHDTSIRMNNSIINHASHVFTVRICMMFIFLLLFLCIIDLSHHCI